MVRLSAIPDNAAGPKGIPDAEAALYVLWVSMASAISHAVAALALGSLFRWNRPPLKYWAAGIFCAVVPDADSIGFALGIRYGDMLGHRGLSHSLLFAAIL